MEPTSESGGVGKEDLSNKGKHNLQSSIRDTFLRKALTGASCQCNTANIHAAQQLVMIPCGLRRNRLRSFVSTIGIRPN